MTQELWSRELSAGLKQLRRNNSLSRAAVMSILDEKYDCHLSEGRLTEVENCRTTTSDFTSPSPAMQGALAAFYASPKSIELAKSRTGGNGGSRGPQPASGALVKAINGHANGS